MWWFNLRASNTEPLLRLNVEAADKATMEQVRDDVLSIIRGEVLSVREETVPADIQPEAGVAAPASSADGPAAASESAAPRVEPWLREILRCPQCRSTLTDGAGPDGPELHCTNTACRRAYRIDDGIPVLLVDESRVLTN